MSFSYIMIYSTNIWIFNNFNNSLLRYLSGVSHRKIQNFGNNLKVVKNMFLYPVCKVPKKRVKTWHFQIGTEDRIL